MKAYRGIVPSDCEVKRDGAWIRYDATALVVGDLIRIEAGDVVPADCIVLRLVSPDSTDDDEGDSEEGTERMLVDLRNVTGEESHRVATTVRPVTARESSSTAPAEATASITTPTQILWGGRVVQGRAICVVTAIGGDTCAASLIREGKFPPAPSSSKPIRRDDGDGASNEPQPSSLASLPSALNDEEEGVALLPIAPTTGSASKRLS
jgi:magnesium-transporting ATPase (P-type)